MSCMKVGEGDVQKVGQGDVQIMCLGRTSVIWVWNWPTQTFITFSCSYDKVSCCLHVIMMLIAKSIFSETLHFTPAHAHFFEVNKLKSPFWLKSHGIAVTHVHRSQCNLYTNWGQ